ERPEGRRCSGRLIPPVGNRLVFQSPRPCRPGDFFCTAFVRRPAPVVPFTMPLHIDILTLFPRMLDGFLAESILGKGIAAGLVGVQVHDLRQWCTDKHRTADDRPFGGGAGMVMKPEPVFAAFEQLQTPGCHRVYLTPDGTPFSEPIARDFATREHLILLSGHYEGIDQRIREHLIDQEVSIGDYVLTNGTLPAAVVVDALARFIPGVLGEEKSLTHESFTGR